MEYESYRQGIHSYIYALKKDWTIESSISNAQGNVAALMKYHCANVISNVNISSTKTGGNCAYILAFSQDLSHVNYSTLYNNSNTEDSCANHNSNKHDINHCNYIKNECEKILEMTTKPATVSFCMFDANKCSKLLVVNNEELTVENCYINQSNSFEDSYSGNVIIKNLTRFINCLTHFSNNYCPDKVYDLCIKPITDMIPIQYELLMKVLQFCLPTCVL